MCELTGETTNRRIGYKVLAYNDNRFYSTFTGQQIKKGKVPKPPIRCNRLVSNWNDDLDNYTLRKCGFYHKDFVGKTSAFIEIAHAKELLYTILDSTIFNDSVIVLVKIEFNNTTYLGKYQEYDIIASDKIKSIEIIYYLLKTTDYDRIKFA